MAQPSASVIIFANWLLVVRLLGRKVLSALPERPTATLRLQWTHLVARACGRLGAQDTPVTIEGDANLGRRALAALAVTP